MPTERQHAHDARDRIARACWRLVADQGIAAISLRQIAAEMAVTTGFLTRYFDAKQPLLMHALARASDTLAARAEAVVGDSDPQHIHAMMQALLPDDEESRLAWHFWLAMGGMQAAHTDFRAAHQHFPDRLRRVLVAVLRQAQQAGQLPAQCYPAWEADLLLAGVSGLCAQMIATPERFGDAKCQALLTMLVLRIGTQGSPPGE